VAEYDKAIANHSGAEAFMGRAIARNRMGDVSGAAADAAEARKLRPDIDDTFAEYGLKFDYPSIRGKPPAATVADQPKPINAPASPKVSVVSITPE
jgi:hypothetical protein